MNPFDLQGPQFLALYAIFGVSVLALLYVGKRKNESGELGQVSLSDPYVIAYLRGGALETLRLGVAVLIDRGLLDMDDLHVLQTRKGTVARHGANELERAILERCQQPEPVHTVVDDPRLHAIARHSYEPDLLRKGLIAGCDVRARRWKLVGGAIAALVVVAAIKVIIGLSRHRPVSFLIASAALFSVCALIATRGVRTVRGDRILGDLEALFDALRHRASGLQPNYATNELALLVAVFGFEPLPAMTYPFVHAFHPKRSSERLLRCGRVRVRDHDVRGRWRR